MFSFCRYGRLCFYTEQGALSLEITGNSQEEIKTQIFRAVQDKSIPCINGCNKDQTVYIQLSRTSSDCLRK